MAFQDIKNAYISYVAKQNRRPYTDFGFIKDTGINEKEFKEFFGSLLAVEQAIWADWFLETENTLKSEAVFAEYSVREKILALNFTFIEKLKAHQDFAKLTLQPLSNFKLGCEVLNEVEKYFTIFIQSLVQEGTFSGEIAERPLITQYYKQLLWFQFLTMIRFWVKDGSNSTENTDAFVEKSVNFAFDMLSKNVADSAFDFVKFWWQQR
jgi:hypothetical protein